MVHTVVAVLRRHHRYTYADYVGLEMDSSTKHEFFDGEILLMLDPALSSVAPALANALYRITSHRLRELPLQLPA
jgi:hypothetical protein